jgi:membrane protein
MANPKAVVDSGVSTVRRKRPFLDHTIRAWSRYQADGGDRLAASVTYFGFLSFFPLVALAFSIAGFVVDAYPDAQQKLTEQINNFLPGLADKLDVASIGNAKVATGIIGLAGLLFAGLGWIDALREAVRAIWHHNVKAGNFVVKKLVDIGVLAGLGLTLTVSVGVTGVSSAAMTWFLDQLGLGDNSVARVGLRVVGIILALLVDFAVFLYLFTRLPRLKTPFRRVAKGAMLGAVGLEILKVVGSLLVSRTTNNPVYGAFAVVVGLLIWINLVSRFMLFTAAWTVTAPYDTDVPPSGTASPEAARAAGIPEEYADTDPDHVPTAAGDGAPAPLAAAIQGQVPPQDEAEGRTDERAERDRAGRGQVPVPTDSDGTDEGSDGERTASRDGASARGGSGPILGATSGGQHRRPARRVAQSADDSGTYPDDPHDGKERTAAGHPRMVASEASLRTVNRVSAGVVLAGAATAAAYGAKILRGSRGD